MSEAVAEQETPKESPTIRKFREENEANLLDYLRSLASETPIKVTVIRELPKTWDGRTIEGTLDSFEDPISEEEIREMFGGGKYKLVVYTPNAKGSWVYATARKIKIAGDPKLDGLITSGKSTNTGADEAPSVVRDAMRMSQQMVARAQERADRAEEIRLQQSSAPNPAMQAMMQELAALRREMAAKDSRLFELATKQESSAAEVLLGKAIEGESARIMQIRQQVESEMRMKNEMHKSEMDRLHQRYEDAARRQEDQHKREIDNLVRANDNQMTVLKASYEGQMEGYKREIAHLDRQLTAAQAEVAELRAKKEKSLIESVTEMATMKEALESFSGKSDDEGGSALERIASNVMGSPLMEGIAARVAGGAPTPVSEPEPEPQAEMEIPVGKPVQLPDGRIIVRKADGTILQLKKKEQAPAPAPSQPDGEIQISDDEIKLALRFMESALAGDADPAEFGRTARNLAPSLTSGPIQQLLKTKGVDAFLTRVSEISPNSPLLSQHGKNWTRKVAAVLLGS